MDPGRASELLRQVDQAIDEAVRQERERILEIVAEEATHYSAQARQTALIFANAVLEKVADKK